MYSKKEFLMENINGIEEMISNHRPLREIARTFDVKYDTLKRFLDNNNVYYTTNQNRKGISHIESRKDSFYYLNSDKTTESSRLKIKLIEDGIKECKCERCGRSEWMNMPIPLELHHKNFKHYDNTLENLEILCSNCHMQIHGYSTVKKNENTENNVLNNNTKHINKCLICGKEYEAKYIGQKYCSQECLHKSQHRLNYDLTIEEFINKFKEYKNFTKLGNYYGVSDKTISRWAEKFNLPNNIKELKKYLNIM